ncbi:MAG: VWA domain-containing protein [candidate division KSB1 bacterium]|nr:VWA domain-containing protein [candidate division KSB1 bacterium]MDZ7353145.1 VWA domain-containing protein [candidate division KSB1 bacterium]MDZ7381164.1 VWA domain-containing protein [candidate division KSB1 bacterium]MDZ7396682.1 VWA domain-containing protein [candidate division KSB1 bacterium]MDZ7417091.1 VWA domain-containing protein [candidate division KSB1 bacterium]
MHLHWVAAMLLLVCLNPPPVSSQMGNTVVAINNISLAGEVSLRGKSGAFPAPILATISVTDRDGNLIKGLADTLRWLTPPELAEIGRPIREIWQPLLEYHRDNPAFPPQPNLYSQTPAPEFTEVRRTEYFPTSTLLVMDISGSMKPQLDDAKAGNLAYLEQLRPYDRAGLIQFCGTVVTSLPITAAKAPLQQSIIAADTCYATAIYDALLTAIEITRFEPSRRGIILYTDGQDNSSTAAPDTVIARAQKYNIPIFTIALGDQPQVEMLMEIAEQTGGLFFYTATAAGMLTIYKKIAAIMQNFYVMAHASPDPVRNHTWRIVDVTANPPGRQGNGKGRYFVPGVTPPRLTDLALTLNASTATARPGDDFEYLLRVHNLGPAAGGNIDLWQQLPDSVRLVEATPAPGYAAGDSLFWQIATLASGAAFDIRVKVRLAPATPVSIEKLISRAELTAANDFSSDNNSAADTVTVLFPPPPAKNTDLALGFSAETQTPGSVSPGESYAYRLRVRNLGPHPGTGIRLSQALPDSVSLLSAVPAATRSGDSLIWHIPQLNAGQVDSFRVNVQFAAQVPSSLTQITSLALITAANDTASANNTATNTLRVISPPPPPAKNTDLALGFSAETQTPGSVSPGESYAYRLRVRNLGPHPGTGIRLSQVLPDSVSLLSAVPAATRSGDSLIWHIPQLNAGQVDSFAVNVQLAAQVPASLTQITSTATLAAANDTSAANNSVTNTLNVIFLPPPLLAPKITATPEVVQVTDSVFIRVQVEQPILRWDLWVYFVTGRIDSSYADGFIAATPLTPQTWHEVRPAFGETRLLTQARQEKIEFELRTIDSFGRFASSRAGVTVRSGNDLVLDRNIYEPEHQGPLAINFRLSSNRSARLDLLDLNGQKVTELITAPFRAGWNTHFWNGMTQDGRRVGSGVYLITLHSEAFNDWKKVIVVR